MERVGSHPAPDPTDHPQQLAKPNGATPNFPGLDLGLHRNWKSVLKEVSPEYPLKGLMLKLKLQYFGLLMRRTDSLEKTLMLGKIKGGRGQQRMRWLDGIINAMDMSLSRF